MKIRHKNIVVSGIAVAAAGVLGVGTVLHTSVAVQASSAMMPGIETIVNGISETEPFRILEIVDSKKDAELGWYISGQEPYVKLYEYTAPDGTEIHFRTFEEGLSKLPSRSMREKFANNYVYRKDENGSDVLDENGSRIPDYQASTLKNVIQVCGTGAEGTDPESYPLSYSVYQEKYFLENGEDETTWNRVELSEVQEEQVQGSYVENPSGTGDYTRQEQSYYPIREDVADDNSRNGKYRENIKSFFASESSESGGDAPYHLVFQEVNNGTFENRNDPASADQIAGDYDYSRGGYGYYENVYDALTEETVQNITAGKYTFPGENPSVTVNGEVIEGLKPADDTLFSSDNMEFFAEEENETVPDHEEVSGEVVYPDEHHVDDRTENGYDSADSGAGFDGTTEFGDGAFSDMSCSSAADIGSIGMNDDPSYRMDGGIVQMSFEEGEFGSTYEDFEEEISPYYGETISQEPEPEQELQSESEQENGSVEELMSGETVLGEIVNEETAGTQENPYIYISESIDVYPNYRYQKVGDLEYIKNTAVPYDKDHPYWPDRKKAVNISINENGQYLFWSYSRFYRDWVSQELYLVTGRQPVSYQDLQTLPEDLGYHYYYKVTDAYFCCRRSEDGEDNQPEDFLFYGGYYASCPQNEETYLPIQEGEAATYYISDAIYDLTPGQGNYDFVPSDDGEMYTVRVNQLFYKGGYVNHDWFKKYVLHLETEEEREKFSIQVDTLTASELLTGTDAFSTSMPALTGYDLIYLNGALQEETAQQIAGSGIPCIINQEKAQAADSGIMSAFSSFGKTEDADGHYVSQYVYFFKNTFPSEDGENSLLNVDFYTNVNQDTEGEEVFSSGDIEGFEEILEYIDSENQYRSIGKENEIGDGTAPELLSRDISQARAVEYILNYRHKRVILNKDVIRVLEIQPAKTGGQLTESQVLKWLGYEAGDTGLNAVSCCSHNGEGAERIQDWFQDTFGDSVANKFASCAELSFLYSYEGEVPEVEIVSMTSSEYAGHIEDMNTEYDLIYIGASGRLNNLVNGEGQMLYTHVGGSVKARTAELMGLMDEDYDPERPVWDGDKASIRSDINQYQIDGLGSMRGSGNDITQQQVDALLDYAKSGYPIVISGRLLTDEGAPDADKVDNSSYMYELLVSLCTAGHYENVYREEEIGDYRINFFANLPKPKIVFEEGGVPASAIGDGNGPSNQYISGKLRYRFHIEDEAEASPANASYHCQLFVDLNSDGNFSDSEELNDLQITDSRGNYLQKDAHGKFALNIGEAYTVVRRIPEDYTKLITWKLKISNNERQQISTTVQGYSKQKADVTKLPDIRILQIRPDDGQGGTWNLTTNSSEHGYDPDFNVYLQQGTQGEFHVEITTMQIRDYITRYKNGYTQTDVPENILDQYDMLIIGFADVYQNIPNEVPEKNGQKMNVPGAVDAILDFVNAGKSVLFAHDTTSFVNFDYHKVTNKDSILTYGPVKTRQWGASLNLLLRPLVGMDRYGIVNSSISGILQQALKLADGTEAWNQVYQQQFYTRSDGSQHADGDMAFANGGSRSRTSRETQGYTNGILDSNLGGTHTTKQAEQVNIGAITEYPFKIPEEIGVANTHGQYYQLALEEDQDRDGLNDIIVWYCLKDGNDGSGYYSLSPRDVRNNYYLYSKGNVMYTGVGHSDVKSAGNNEFEKKLFVNTIVASYRASVVSPEIRFVSDFSRGSAEKRVEYYATDQFQWSGTEANVVDSEKKFYFTVDDYNMIASNSFEENRRSLDLELYIDSPEDGSTAGADVGLDGVTANVIRIFPEVYENQWGSRAASSNGVYQVSSGNVYGFSIADIEKYLKNQNGEYKNGVHIYAKVSTNFVLYGRATSGKAAASVSLKQRQLFELD